MIWDLILRRWDAGAARQDAARRITAACTEGEPRRVHEFHLNDVQVRVRSGETEFYERGQVDEMLGRLQRVIDELRK